MPALSRRAFIAAGGTGAAGVALAACGAEAESDRSADADAELLQLARTPEADLELIYRKLAKGTAEGPGEKPPPELMTTLQERALARIERLNELFEQAVGDGARPPAGPGVSGAVDLALAADALEQAIAAYREAAALLSTAELRTVAYEYAAQDAAELAIVRELLGQNPSPSAFVTGLDEEPYEPPASDSEETTDEEAEPTTTTTTTATEDEG